MGKIQRVLRYDNSAVYLDLSTVVYSKADGTTVTLSASGSMDMMSLVNIYHTKHLGPEFIKLSEYVINKNGIVCIGEQGIAVTSGHLLSVTKDDVKKVLKAFAPNELMAESRRFFVLKNTRSIDLSLERVNGNVTMPDPLEEEEEDIPTPPTPPTPPVDDPTDQPTGEFNPKLTLYIRDSDIPGSMGVVNTVGGWTPNSTNVKAYVQRSANIMQREILEISMAAEDMPLNCDIEVVLDYLEELPTALMLPTTNVNANTRVKVSFGSGYMPSGNGVGVFYDSSRPMDNFYGLRASIDGGMLGYGIYNATYDDDRRFLYENQGMIDTVSNPKWLE